MLLMALLHTCWPSAGRVRDRRTQHGPSGLLASRVFWLGGLASAALWALALEIAFG